MSRLFEVMRERESSGNFEHECFMSMVEIYNESSKLPLALRPAFAFRIVFRTSFSFAPLRVVRGEQFATLPTLPRITRGKSMTFSVIPPGHVRA